MRLTRPALAVSRSHDGWVLITDATSPGLQWRLSAAAAQDLATQIQRAHAAGHLECAGVVTGAAGTVLTFCWPRRDVDGAIADLLENARAIERGRCRAAP